MANLREIRRRIRSVTNTAQITRAMQMVAATKMRRAQAQDLAARPYDETLITSLSTLLQSNKDELEHPLLEEGKGKETAILLLSTDKSLCGSLNTNLFRVTQYFFEQHKPAKFITIGKKGRDFVARSGKELIADFDNPEKIDFRSARQAAKLALEMFLNGQINSLYLAFPQFVSTLRQESKIVKLLPIEVNQLSEIKNPSTQSTNNLFLFEPNTHQLLDFVLTHYVETRIYQALLETKASEHSARMIAMQNATDNAQDLVEDLKLTYNQTRQGAITAELLDITSAGFAFE